MSEVPPRRGQRIKSNLLSPFNGGNAFKIVQHNEHLGIVQRRHGQNQTFVWLEHDLKPRLLYNNDFTVLPCPNVSQHAYEEYRAIIGGVGQHFRWKVLMPNKKMHGAAKLHVKDVSDQDQFAEFVKNNLQPFAHDEVEFVNSDAFVIVPDLANIGTVAAALHFANYAAHAADPNVVSGAKLAIERYDRSEHMWWNQDQKKAGPLRDVHRWVFDFIPSSWSHLPFTWQAMCENITLDPLTNSEHLPRPLRDFYLTSKISSAEETHDTELAQQLKALRGKPAVTCRLSEEQNRQLLQATYWCLIAPFDANTVRMCKLIRFRYMLHGYTAREIGEYKQTAKNLGHGATIRKFRNKPQYKPENLDNTVLNRIYQADGSMRGSGFKGTRGKYGHTDFPKYIPSKRMHRTAVQEKRVRLAHANPFDEYRQDTVDNKPDDQQQNDA